MEELKFCPKCGSQTLSFSEGKKLSCSSCSFVLFHNVAGAVAVLVTFEDEILFTRRNQEPKKGKLDLAGGFTDPSESAEETCVRELREEMNIEVEISQLQYLASKPNIYEYKNILYNTLDLFYQYPVKEKFSPELEISEISETVWLKKSEIDLDDIAFDSQRDFLKKMIHQ